MESLLDADAFDRSLLLNLLFQRGLSAPDIFFLISGGLERQLENPSLTLVEAALETGLLAPSFRDPTAASLTWALNIIQTQKIHGVRDTAKRTMTRLRRSIDANRTFEPIIPKVSLGRTFDDRLGVLEADDSLIAGPSFGVAMDQKTLEYYWRITKPWRQQGIEEARANSRKQFGEGAGIRRGEIMNAVGRNLTDDTSIKVDDVAELFKAFPDRSELRVFSQWICEIYGYSQALAMGITPSFPAYNAFSVISLGPGSLNTPPIMPYASPPTISETVESPSLHALRRVSPNDIVAVRKDKGAEYLSDLEAWQTSPDGTQAETNVRKSLGVYAKALVRWSKTEAKNPVTVVLTHLPPTWRPRARRGGEFALNVSCHGLRERQSTAELILTAPTTGCEVNILSAEDSSEAVPASHVKAVRKSEP